jgi:NAD-dependent SIR2 family protein deacetylase
MVMPKQIIRYQCEHCHKRTYASKYRIIEHESKCFWNPAIKSCITCNNATLDRGEDGSWCELFQKAILVHGDPIRNCPGWEILKYQEDDYE